MRRKKKRPSESGKVSAGPTMYERWVGLTVNSVASVRHSVVIVDANSTLIYLRLCNNLKKKT